MAKCKHRLGHVSPLHTHNTLEALLPPFYLLPKLRLTKGGLPL